MYNFKKKWGQNFLIDNNILSKIVSTVSILPNSLVIEIGCGDGRLTSVLCQNFDYVLGYEIDNELEAILNKNMSSFSNFNLILDDFLKRDIVADISNFSYDNLYIISNLPYYITTPIIEKVIISNINPVNMVFMVQKEVGDRFCAKVGTREYGSISVYLNYFFDIRKEFIVSRNCFFPKPNVDSVIVNFKGKKEKIFVADSSLFFNLIRDSFKFKRKNLKNNLSNYNLSIISKVLNKYGYDLTVRAEMLSVDIFCDIANNLVRDLKKN